MSEVTKGWIQKVLEARPNITSTLVDGEGSTELAAMVALESVRQGKLVLFCAWKTDNSIDNLEALKPFDLMVARDTGIAYERLKPSTELPLVEVEAERVAKSTDFICERLSLMYSPFQVGVSEESMLGAMVRYLDGASAPFDVLIVDGWMVPHRSTPSKWVSYFSASKETE